MLKIKHRQGVYQQHGVLNVGKIAAFAGGNGRVGRGG